MASTGDTWRRTAVSALTLAMAALAAGVSASVYLTKLPPIWFGDADWYMTGLPALVGDAPLYPPEWLGDHVAERPPRFNLPPAAALFAPLAVLGRVPWGVLMGGCLVAALVIVWPRLSGRRGLYLACAVAGLWPVWAALAWANLNSLVLLLIAVAWRWPRHAGWAIGAAAAVKVAPLFLFAVLVGRRDWRGVRIGVAVGAGLTLGATAVTDWRAPWHFLLVQWHESHHEGTWRYSVSDVVPEPWPLLLALLLAVAAAARGGSWLLAVVASLVAVPTLHHHYLIWLLVPLLGAVGRAPRGLRGLGQQDGEHGRVVGERIGSVAGVAAYADRHE